MHSKVKLKQVGSYSFQQMIGKGKYAEVYRCVDMQTKKHYAVKKLDRIGIRPSHLRNISNEITILEKIKHRNVVQLYDRMKSDNNFYLVLDYCNGGDLNDYIKLVGAIPEAVARLIVKQLCEGMSHIASLCILHRDLKAANIFPHFPERENEIDVITN